LNNRLVIHKPNQKLTYFKSFNKIRIMIKLMKNGYDEKFPLVLHATPLVMVIEKVECMRPARGKTQV